MHTVQYVYVNMQSLYQFMAIAHLNGSTQNKTIAHFMSFGKINSLYPCILTECPGAEMTAPINVRTLSKTILYGGKNVTWVKHLSYRLCKIAVLLEMLRKRREVACMRPPIGIEIVQSCCIWTSTSQEGRSAGAAKCLLQSKQQLNVDQ